MPNQQDPTDWENHYQEGITPWDKGAPAPPLVEHLETDQIAGRILVPGCGYGHDVRAIAAARAESEVVGLDISATAISGAKKQSKVGQESYVHGDLFDLPDELRGHCDYVFEHTCLSGLPPALRPDYAEAFHTALKPGGHVLGIFFLTPWDKDEVPEPPPYGVSLEELDQMFGERFELLKEWEPTRFYPGREGREIMRLLRRVN
ncbi:MAG: SAM-dependent methyltransferase [Verrucomicrobiales bacterium]|jgi:SAM-dependent methyltransferase